MVAFIQSKSLELHKKQTFKTCQFNESTLSICRRKCEYTCSENKSQKKAHFMDEGLKIRGIKYLNVETRWLFPTPLSQYLATRLIPYPTFQQKFQ